MIPRYDATLNYAECQGMSDEQVLVVLQDMFPGKDLYSVSNGWRADPKYILKAKGAYGDVICNWERG